MNTIHKTARDFAIKNRISLGRLENGYYYIGHGREQLVSKLTTAKSAMALMRSFLAVSESAAARRLANAGLTEELEDYITESVCSCGASTGDGEGWDGLCGNCADKADS